MNDTVYALTTLPNGDLVAGGDFAIMGGVASACFAQLAPPCPATTTSYGNGCSGSAGPSVLAADALPWTGGVFRATASPIAANSLPFGVLGSSAGSTPLSSLHPSGGSGCTLLVSPDSATLLSGAGGSATWQVHVPNAPALAGTVVFGQVLQVELDPALAITTITSSNALSLTLGTF